MGIRLLKELSVVSTVFLLILMSMEAVHQEGVPAAEVGLLFGGVDWTLERVLFVGELLRLQLKL